MSVDNILIEDALANLFCRHTPASPTDIARVTAVNIKNMHRQSSKDIEGQTLNATE